MEEIIKKLTNEVCSISRELLSLWKGYVKKHGEVNLHGVAIAMWDGCCEHMEKLILEDDKLMLVDLNKNKWTLNNEIDIDILMQIYDVVFEGKYPKPIGYQIDFGEDKWPEGLFSFQVFRTEQDAKDYMNETGNKGDIVPIFDGDIEEPTFIGKKPRIFKQGERVFNCEYSEGDKDLHDWARVCRYTEVEYEDDIVLIQMENGGDNETDANSLYQIAEGKSCPRCGGPLCIEHHDEIDYPYYCPCCDENFYGIEVK